MIDEPVVIASEEIIRTACLHFNLAYLLKHQELSEATLSDIALFLSNEDWETLWVFQTVSERFIRNHIGYANWNGICGFQPLSENFIEEFQDNLDWELVSIHQKLSMDFIEQHSDVVDWNAVLRNQSLTTEFVLTHLHKVTWTLNNKRTFLQQLESNNNWSETNYDLERIKEAIEMLLLII